MRISASHSAVFDINARARNSLKKWLERLHSLIPITAAAVALEHSLDSAPAFRAFVLLACTRAGHPTLKRAITRLGWPGSGVSAALRKQIQQRKAKQLARSKSMGQQPMFTAPWLKGGVPNFISLKTIKRVVTVVVGGTYSLSCRRIVGIARLQRSIVIPLGLAILAAEFTWARRWLRKARDLLPNEQRPGRRFSAFVARHTKNFLEWAFLDVRATTAR